MINRSKKLKVNLIITLGASAISLTSFLYLTYSWFVFPRVSSINAMEIKTESNVQCTLKYFTKNYTTLGTPSGYYGPSSFIDPADYVTVDDYQTQFLPISQDPYLNSSETVVTTAQFPGLRFTYALEVLGDFSDDKELFLAMTNFVSPPSATLYDATTLNPITMAAATNIYATAIDGNGDVSTTANNFVTSTNSPDLFVTTASSGPCDILLATDTLSSPENPMDISVFLFTVEFSNDPATYYDYSSSVNGIDYYQHDVEGSSNVYKNLSFALTELTIRVS